MICDKCGKEKEVWGSRRTPRKMDTFLINEIGNLQQQLAEKEKEIERLTSSCEYFINHNNHIVRKLPLGEEEIILAPKQICDLLNGYSHEFMDCQERIAQLRHQICEETRERMCCIYDYKNDEYLNGWNDAMHTVYDKLDQIEKRRVSMKTQDIKELDVDKITNEIIDTISSHFVKEIKVLHKALELACEYVKDEWEGTGLGDRAKELGGFENLFIQQATEIEKGE